MTSLLAVWVLFAVPDPIGRNPAVFHEDGRKVWLFSGSSGLTFPSDEPLALEVRFHRGLKGCAGTGRVEVEQGGKRIAVVAEPDAGTVAAPAGYRDFPTVASRPIRVDVPAVRGGTATFRLTGGTCGGSLTSAPAIARPPASPRPRPIPTKAFPTARAAAGKKQVTSPAPSKARPPHAGSPAKLIAAAKSGDLEAVRRELDRGTPVDATDGEVDAFTALGWAAYRGHLYVAELLLERGARIDAANRLGYTPLMAAAQAGHGEIVGFLLEKGADPNLATRNGETALLYAAMFGSAETVRSLLEKGADRSARNRMGDTARSLAAALGRQDVSAVLAEPPRRIALRSAGE